MSLLSALNTASTALNVFSRALGVEQINVSNSSTAGFAAIRANILPIGTSGQGAGTSDFIQLSSAGDIRSDAQVQQASSEAASSQTSTQQLTPLNQLFDITGSSGILSALRQFSTAFSAASVSPNDQTLRSTALLSAGNVATAFNKVAASVDAQSSQITDQVQTTIANINSLADQIRHYNVQTRSSAQPDFGNDAAPALLSRSAFFSRRH